MRPASLIFNPVAGRHGAARRVPALLAALREGGFDVEAIPTAAPGDAAHLARARAAAGDEVVFALGGDGTVREVAAGLLGTEAALGILPSGTTNVLARALGLPTRALPAARMAGRARVAAIDVGLCASAAGERPFLMMVSSGLDAWLLARLDPNLKRRLGRFGIGLQALGAWWRYGYPEIDVEVDGFHGRGSFAAVCNIEIYGGGMRLAPGTRPDSGRLALVLFHGRSRRATLAFALALARGRHVARRDVDLVPIAGGAQIRLAGPATLRAQIDGDALPEALPLTLRLAPTRLRVLVPGTIPMGSQPA